VNMNRMFIIFSQYNASLPLSLSLALSLSLSLSFAFSFWVS
jgi:hypothetical protein